MNCSSPQAVILCAYSHLRCSFICSQGEAGVSLVTLELPNAALQRRKYVKEFIVPLGGIWPKVPPRPLRGQSALGSSGLCCGSSGGPSDQRQEADRSELFTPPKP
eukprot:4320432-Amphidinium_carterae.1